MPFAESQSLSPRYLAYANKTCQLRINEVPESLLDDAGLPAQ